ncbi:hypothetical protein EUX98_g7676 [Antrodiella citrinella]|uniref:DUF6532 domain-containing protein n=1 Tax=Antrodiella citrinella TaxID=2447956 RepID=A0A4S4ML92_9APHY|nr:hypothetical protein EUX98_g7676 [Antrodiella citrinella]
MAKVKDNAATKAAKKAAKKQVENEEAAALIAAGSAWMNGASENARKRAFSTGEQNEQPLKKNKNVGVEDKQVTKKAKKSVLLPAPHTESRKTVADGSVSGTVAQPQRRRQLIEVADDDEVKTPEHEASEDSDGPVSYERRMRIAKKFITRNKGFFESQFALEAQGAPVDDVDRTSDAVRKNQPIPASISDDESSSASTAASDNVKDVLSEGEDENDDLDGQSRTQLRRTLAREVPVFSSPGPQAPAGTISSDEEVPRPVVRRRVASTASSDYSLPPPSTDVASGIDAHDIDDADSDEIAAPARRSVSSHSRPELALFNDKLSDDSAAVQNRQAIKASRMTKPTKKLSAKTDKRKPGKRELKRRLEQPQFEGSDDAESDEKNTKAILSAVEPKRKAATAKVEAFPDWTELVLNRRNDINLLPQHPRVITVLRAVNYTMNRNCILVHAYPEVNEKYDYIRSSIHTEAEKLDPEISRRMTHDARYAELMVTIVCVSFFFLPCSPILIAQLYGLNGVHSGVIVPRVKALLDEHACLFGLKPGNEVIPILHEPFKHPMVTLLLKATLFLSPASLGHKFCSQFPVVDGEIEIPIPVLAIIATVIEVGLMAWSSGTHHPTHFTAEGTIKVYEGVLGYIAYLKDGLSAAQFHRMLSDIFQSCRSSSVPIPSSGVVVSHKVDFAKMPQ